MAGFLTLPTYNLFDRWNGTLIKKMVLLKLKDLYPQMINRMRDSAVIGFTVYANEDEKVGTVKDILVDEDTGKFQYLIVDLGFWIFGKEVLLPIERAQVSAGERRVDAE